MNRFVAGGAIAAVLLASPLVRADAATETKKACGTSYENAQLLMAKESLRAARGELERCTASACAAFVREECTKWSRDVDAAMPSVVLIFADGTGASVTPTAFTVDGVETPLPSAGAGLDLDPGKHVLAATRGTDHASIEVTTERGKKHVTTRLVFAAPQTTETRPGTSTTASLPYVVGGLGAAAVVTSLVLGGVAKSELDDLDVCKGHCAQRDVDAVDTKIGASTVFFAVGVVALAVSTYLFLARDKRASTRAPNAHFVF